MHHPQINILIVDDNCSTLKSLEAYFASPLFKISCADKYSEAIAKSRHHGTVWHCWILDIDLGDNRSGLDIMKASPGFPFVLILSGLNSMHIAAEAVRLGAMAVFDKVPEMLESFFNEACKVAALGYLLGGKTTQYLPVYRLLLDSVITSIENWAEKACLSLRQLHRITGLHPIDTPKASLALYYAVYYRLFTTRSSVAPKKPPGATAANLEFFSECLNYCSHHF